MSLQLTMIIHSKIRSSQQNQKFERMLSLDHQFWVRNSTVIFAEVDDSLAKTRIAVL